MLRLIVATGMMDSNPSFSVPGAAANTTSHLASQGVPNAALCDGPAGLRLQRTSVKMPNGRIKPVDAMIEFMDSMPWLFRKFMFGNPKKGTPLYQYTTAFPVGTALAQTWNTELIEKVGYAVGVEMVEYGVTFLLAPGMNIQRNPLCGRNYEYYSEDPLLTGKMAAAVTRGVQSHDGCYVTLKHYAANNQETNRCFSDSRINERALREIYLRGYRIAIEEAGAKGVMTSYNKINGVYTPNNHDLCTKVLRCEWGFGGVVMTDWFSTGKGLASDGAAIKAGNDLICPGGGYHRKEIKKALKDGQVDIEDVKVSCARVLEAVIGGRTGKM
jgi:beta-glucosidase